MSSTRLSLDSKASTSITGVVLIVAVTILLSVTIGVFLLDLGEDVEQQPPQGTFSIERTDTENTVTVLYEQGDEIPQSEIDILVDGTSVRERGNEPWSGSSEVKAGDSYTTELRPSQRVDIVWDADPEIQSATSILDSAAFDKTVFSSIQMSTSWTRYGTYGNERHDYTLETGPIAGGGVRNVDTIELAVVENKQDYAFETDFDPSANVYVDGSSIPVDTINYRGSVDLRSTYGSAPIAEIILEDETTIEEGDDVRIELRRQTGGTLARGDTTDTSRIQIQLQGDSVLTGSDVVSYSTN